MKLRCYNNANYKDFATLAIAQMRNAAYDTILTFYYPQWPY